VGVDEAGQGKRVGGHEAATLPPISVADVAWTELRARIPNALTILRFAAIPAFLALFLRAGAGAAWWAGVFFAGAAATDQLDGYLARRWHVESSFGKVADPLADRLMIVTAVVAMWTTGRIPLLAAAIVVGRDLLLLAGYKLLVPRGYELDVSLLGKVATWILYASLCLVLVTPEGEIWPLVLLWLGIVVALAAGIQYLLRARRELTAPEQGLEGSRRIH
jgi:CDP-diacylglycerol--glycerol-3-phosphate 3-phosphatidyltransferase